MAPDWTAYYPLFDNRMCWKCNRILSIIIIMIILFGPPFYCSMSSYPHSSSAMPTMTFFICSLSRPFHYRKLLMIKIIYLLPNLCTWFFGYQIIVQYSVRYIYPYHWGWYINLTSLAISLEYPCAGIYIGRQAILILDVNFYSYLCEDKCCRSLVPGSVALTTHL